MTSKSLLTEKQSEWLLSQGIDESVWSTLQNSVFVGANPESIIMAVQYCKARGLDVLKKPVHIVPMNVKDAKSDRYVWRDVIMAGIAEHRITAMRSGEYGGQSAPVFGKDIEFKGVKAPENCSITVYRIINGIKCEFTHIERFEEAVSLKKDGSVNAMWSKRPYGQLAKTTEAGALRKAFPEELGGLITKEESLEEIDITPPKSREARQAVEKNESETIFQCPDELRDRLEICASEGLESLKAEWQKLSTTERANARFEFDNLVKFARSVDEKREADQAAEFEQMGGEESDLFGGDHD